jgi:hypothetical protein
MTTAAAPIEAAPAAAPLSTAPAPAAPAQKFGSMREAAEAHRQEQSGTAPAAKPAVAKPAATDATQKPNGEKPAAPAAPKKPGSAMDALKAKPAAESLETGKEGAAAKTGTEAESKEQSRWLQLKAAETELQTIKPQYEALQKEIEKFNADKQAWETKQKEYDELKNERSWRDYTKTDEYIKEIEAPFAKVGKYVQDVADYAGVDVKGLMQAMNEPNPLIRGKKITAVLEEAKESVDAGVVATLVEKGNALQDLYELHDQHKASAGEKQAQHENATKAQKLKAETEAREILTRAHNEVTNNVFRIHKDVFDEGFAAAVKEAFPGFDGKDALAAIAEWAQQEETGDPMDKAYQAQTNFAFPAAVNYIRALKAKIATLESAKTAEQQARPGITPAATQANGVQRMTLREAAEMDRQAGRSFGTSGV